MSDFTLSQNEWFLKNTLISFQQSKRSKRNDNLIRNIFPSNQIAKIANACFESCVKDFGSDKLSSDESICLSNCKSNSIAFYTNINH